MTKKIWKMCVVGLICASPLVCTATADDIAIALADADDGQYVDITAQSSTIRLTFDFAEGTPEHPAVKLTFRDASAGISVWYYDYDDTPIMHYSYGEGYPAGSVLYVDAPDTFAYMTITRELVGYVVSLDGVQFVNHYQEEEDVLYGTCDSGTATGSVEVVLTAVGTLQFLAEEVIAINEAQGIENVLVNSLEVKLQSALSALEDAKKNSNTTAANKLQAFVNEVEDQRGNKITEQQADYLVWLADRVIVSLLWQ